MEYSERGTVGIATRTLDFQRMSSDSSIPEESGLLPSPQSSGLQARRSGEVEDSETSSMRAGFSDANVEGGHNMQDVETGYGPSSSQGQVVQVRDGLLCCTKVGNTILLFGKHPGRRHFPRKCLVGPDWPCLMCTYTLILVPNLLALIYVYVCLLLLSIMYLVLFS